MNFLLYSFIIFKNTKKVCFIVERKSFYIKLTKAKKYIRNKLENKTNINKYYNTNKKNKILKKSKYIGI